MYFPDEKAQPSVAEIEEKYWNIVLLGTQHVSVNTAFIESGVEGNISPKSKTSDAITTSPWYLKVRSKKIFPYIICIIELQTEL